VVMDGGRVAETGTHDQLIASEGIYAMLHRLQTGEPGARQELAAEFGLLPAQ
jgi:ABC-type transport system involved in cytochrome bd biosynthesis fused ATPase/permease subunit